MKLFLIFSTLLVLGKTNESEVLKEFADNNVAYIGTLYKELIKKHADNFLVCPLSIQSVFALVNGGAKGETAKQITSALHLPETEEKVKEVFTELGKTLRATDQYTFSSANKVYVADYFKIHPQYKSTAVNVFRSGIESTDFSKPSIAVEKINKWVEEKTHNKIKNLLNDDMVDANTVAVLVNALYFQGEWLNKFETVFKAPFKLNTKQSVETEMMKVNVLANYYESSELKAKFVELPYKGEDVTMTIILPYEIDGLAHIENHIGKVLAEPDYDGALVNVTLPKFKIETTTHLVPILINMGIKDAFTPAADFSGISENESNLFITESIQKAFIEVDEQGTTASAATAILMGRSGRRYEDTEFVADHPFLFYLKHNVNGIIFIGRFAKPAEAN